ncbi:hypothetical protein D3C76_1434750 [compost metagenome]
MLFRPAFIGDGFPRQIDYGVKAVEILMLGEPFPDIDAGAECLTRFLGTARHHRQLMAQRLQAGDQMPANQAGTAGYQDLHTTSGGCA